MKLEITNRGFICYSGKDRYDAEYSLQESSIASEACIWLGSKPNRMHLTQSMVKEMIPLLQHFVEHGDLRLEKDDE